MKKWITYITLALSMFLITILSLIFKVSNNINTFKIILVIILSIIVIIISATIYLKLKNKESFKKENIILSTFDWLSFALMTISLILYINMFLFSIAKVEGSSMNNTLYDKDYLFVRHFNNHPKVEDIVIIHLENGDNLVKRIKAAEGDVISYVYDENKNYDYLVINGEKTLYEFRDKNVFVGDSYTLKKGEYFVLGDNIINSKDSRDSSIGIILEKEIIGKYIFKF